VKINEFRIRLNLSNRCYYSEMRRTMVCCLENYLTLLNELATSYRNEQKVKR